MIRDSTFERLPAGHRVQPSDPGRADVQRLQREIRAIAQSPVVTAVLEVADATLLVLNRERQIVGFNSRVADLEAAGDVLGLRPGEAVGCINAASPGGCGTAPACASCGSLAAVVECQARGRPVEAECLIRSERAPGKALEFNVRASPVTVGDQRFTVVSLRDISSEKRREVLEQVFFHDVLNTVAGLRGWAERLQRGGGDSGRAPERIGFLTGQIEREIQDHRALVLAERGVLVPERRPLRTADLLHDVVAFFTGHAVARDRRLDVGVDGTDVELVSDRALLLRVLVNMVRNALEATDAGGIVRLSCEPSPGSVSLRVHNAGVIAPEVQVRIFQRSFSTKAARGRGLGTYSMKLFGERYLGGQVSFVSTSDAGTVFTIRVPATPLPVAG